MKLKGVKYRILVDGLTPHKDVEFLVPLKPHQLDRVARKFADTHKISWQGVKIVRVLNGVK